MKLFTWPFAVKHVTFYAAIKDNIIKKYAK